MMHEQSQTSAPERRLQEVLLAYVEAVEAGQAPDRERLLADHPDLAEELRDYFAGHDQVNEMAAVLRQPSLGAAGLPAGNRAPAAPLGELGDFRLLREIGRGGMGVVYEAEQISLHRRVALKVLPFAAAFDPRQLQRFRIEAQAAAQLHHTNIVPVFAVGSERGVHYYAMQFIEGQSLAGLIAELRQTAAANPGVTATPSMTAGLSTARSTQPRQFFNTVARLGTQAAEALEHAHQMGIVHRDIKPGNLMLDERGQVWITDFGLAQFRSDTELTATGEVLGTLRYASPEQARARPGVVDQRSDVYALGATLYELLTLHPVFDGRDRGELLRQITFEEPAAPRSHVRAIPIELETIVLKALAKSPTDRYATAKELAADLQRFLDDKPILARRPSWGERAAKWSRRHRPVVFSAVVLLVMGVIALSVSTLLVAQAYASERLKAEEARKAQARAEENYQRAKRVVDLLTKLSEEELAGFPPLDGVRRKMLDAALEYYGEFLDQQQGDPANQPELAASHARVTRLLAELSAIQGHAQMMYLDNPDVQDELQATPQQRNRVVELNRKIAEEWRALSNLPAEQRQTKWAHLARDHETALADLLTPEQRRRLQQISWQVRARGAYGFRDPEIVTALQMTVKQQQDIRAIQEEAGTLLWGAAMDVMGSWSGPKEGPGQWGGPKEGPGLRGGSKESPGPRKGPDSAERVHQRMLDVLTAEQKARWRELTGEPFYSGPPFPMKGPGGFGKPPRK